MKNETQRVILPSSDDYRLELFSKNPDTIVNREYPAFKLGFFRVKQANSDVGERYFITDLMEENQLVDVIMIHDDASKKLIRTYGLEPAFICKRIEMYRIGLYQAHALYILSIDTEGVRLINKFD